MSKESAEFDVVAEEKSLARKLADKLNIKYDDRTSDSAIVAQIAQQPVAYQRDAMKHVAETPVPAVHDNTSKMVLDAIEPYMKEGFEATFPDDGTWYFKYKGREECGNLKIPLRLIKMKAENVSKGALKPRLMNFDGDLILTV